MININMEQNKYYNWYMNIIDNALAQNRVKKRLIHEVHHIIPQSIGGSDDNSNKVILTYREHFICHHLLTKFTTGEAKSKMLFAFWNMANKWGRKQTEYKINSNIYAILKKEIVELISKNNKGKSHPVTDETKKLLSDMRKGDKNPMYGKTPHNKGKKRPGIGGRKKGTKWSDQERKKQMIIRQQDGYYDYLQNPERREKISTSLTGKPGIATGKTWYNNGIIEKYDFSCPIGFIKGRLSKAQLGKRGMKWYNNGIINKQFFDHTVEQGFIRGRINKK